MRTGKLPQDAFPYYVGLGIDRSYKAVAERFGVTKRTVTRTAAREGWMERLAEIERKARETIDEKLTHDVEEMNARHRKILRAMGSRAARALADYPLNTGMEGIRAAEIAIKLERLLAGEPSDRNEVTIEQVTRDEIGRLLTVRPRNASDGNDW